MNIVKINDETIKGVNNLTLHEGKVLVDGQDVTPVEKEIYISVRGDLSRLEVNDCEKITIDGDVGNISLGMGDIDIKGNVNNVATTNLGDITIAGDVGVDARTNMGMVTSNWGTDDDHEEESIIFLTIPDEFEATDFYQATHILRKNGSVQIIDSRYGVGTNGPVIADPVEGMGVFTVSGDKVSFVEIARYLKEK